MVLMVLRRTLLAENRARFFNTVIPQRDFNKSTLENVRSYLEENKEKVRFERNESGFIRTTFPNEVLTPDINIAPLADDEVLRANFWYYDNASNCSMGDESIHDHPRNFQSYIVKGGYEHELYQLQPSQSDFSFSLKSDPLRKLYNAFFGNSQDINAFQFSIDKYSKNISYQGTVLLKKTGVEQTKAGDIVSVDTNLIHRVSKYHTVPGEKTLSLNIVRNNGKFTTNIYLPEKKVASVKIEREKLTAEESELACDEMIRSFKR